MWGRGPRDCSDLSKDIPYHFENSCLENRPFGREKVGMDFAIYKDEKMILRESINGGCAYERKRTENSDSVRRGCDCC